MILVKTIEHLQEITALNREAGRQIGMVPTMGALHPGHISLINSSKQAGEYCVCSIFINPAQFNDPSDFEKYPVTIEEDIDLLEGAGCDLLFLPGVATLYPAGDIKKVFDLGYLEQILEGKYRPGHFQGVCRVVDKFLSIVRPDRLYLGQKDYQQCMVVRKMMALEGHQAEMTIMPTLREADGLAMSSRNLRLNDTQRKQAIAISRSLYDIKEHIAPGNVEGLAERSIAKLTAQGFNVDYISIADAGTLEPVTDWDGRQALVALVAAYSGEVRLIDNVLLHAP